MKNLRIRLALRLLGVAAIVFAVHGTARAGPTREEMEAVETRIRAVAREATPKTVAIRVERGGKALGFGSGAVVSAEGLVLTCAHVTEPARGGRLVAIFADGREAPLAVVASNAHNDFALCRTEPAGKGLPHFEIAEKDPAMGAWVVALGHPGGPYADHRPTVSAGKVTAVGRRLPILLQGKEYVDAIQTDAPLFGGNSGGPLADLEGRLAGINGAILLVGDASFSTPASRLRRDLPSLREGKDVEGESIGFGNLFAAMMDLSQDLDPQELADAFADSGLGRILRALVKLTSSRRPEDAPPRAARRTDDLRAAFGGAGDAVDRRCAVLVRDGKDVGLACRWDASGGRARWLTAARLVEARDSAYAVRLGTPPGILDVRTAKVLGRDGGMDLAILETAAPDDETVAAPSPARDVAPGAWALLPGPDAGSAAAAGIVSAVDREVGTDRRIPTLGILNLFKPPNTSPFRPYPAMTQVDCPLAANQFGGPVLRPNGSLVGIAVAHFHRAVTFVVPAARIVESIEALAKGADVPAPPTYDPRGNSPSRDAVDGAGRAEAAPVPSTSADDSVSLWVPTLSGVPRRARFVAAPAGAAALGPTAEIDTGAGVLDVRAGDVLASVAGKSTPDAAAAIRAIGALKDGAKVRIGLLRRTDSGSYRFESIDARVEGDGPDRRVTLEVVTSEGDGRK